MRPTILVPSSASPTSFSTSTARLSSPQSPFPLWRTPSCTSVSQPPKQANNTLTPSPTSPQPLSVSVPQILSPPPSTTPTWTTTSSPPPTRPPAYLSSTVSRLVTELMPFSQPSPSSAPAGTLPRPGSPSPAPTRRVVSSTRPRRFSGGASSSKRAPVFGIGAACLVAATSSRDGRQHKPCFFFLVPFLVAVDGFRNGEKKRLMGGYFWQWNGSGLLTQTRTA